MEATCCDSQHFKVGLPEIDYIEVKSLENMFFARKC